MICVREGLRKRDDLLELDALHCMRLTPMRSVCDGAGHRCSNAGSIYVSCDRYTARGERREPEMPKRTDNHGSCEGLY